MVKTSFATSWIGSTQPRKQRKYRYNAPLHIRQKFLNVHLSAELRKKYAQRQFQVRNGDKVTILRGQHKKKGGKVDRVDLKHERVYVTGLEYLKKDGTKVPISFTPSNLMIVELDLSDKKRKQKLTKDTVTSSESKKAISKETKKDEQK